MRNHPFTVMRFARRLRPAARFVAATCLLLPIATAGCAPAVSNSGKSQKPILVFAAASTADALDAVLAEYRKSHNSADIKTSYGASSTLAQQIANGAGAALFLSADEDWVKFLTEKDLVSNSRLLLSNSLVVIVPSKSKIKIERLEDLADDRVKKLALADPDSVPAGKYAKKAFESLGLWEKVRPKVVSGNDVRRAMSFVETGAADAGIVYRTDAALSPRVTIAVHLPESQTGPVRYVLALLKSGSQSDPCVALFEYLAGPEASAVFRRFGFGASESLNVAADAATGSGP